MRVSHSAEEKTAPFELGPARAPSKVLLVHGFTGSPWDVRPLGEALAKEGHHVRGIRLPGHGSVSDAVPEITSSDWEAAVTDALMDLSAEGPVHLAGLSMGALLSVVMAARHPQRVRSLTLVAPAMQFIGPTMALVKAARSTPVLEWIRPWVDKASTDLSDDAVRREAPVLHRFPTAWLRSLYRIQDEARSLMHDVRCPALIVAADNDHVVSSQGARELAKAFHGAVRMIRLPRSFHIIPRDVDAPRLFDEAAAFLKTVSP